jgi:hypothetical protein
MASDDAKRTVTRRMWLGGTISLALAPTKSGSAREFGMTHVVLLGDSVFDNGAYVSGGPDVVGQLRSVLPPLSRASLAAVDGAVMASVPDQLRRVPSDATHLAISVGGNDALRQAGLLDAPLSSMSDALDRLSAVATDFRSRYAALLNEVAQRGLPTAVCTIYDPRFSEPGRRRQASTALSVLNDAITREAFARGLTLLDLRLICDEDADFANPIEPSVPGGRKIANSIAAFATLPRTTERASRVIAR